MADMLLEAREEWGGLHATTIDAVVMEDNVNHHSLFITLL